MRKNKIIFALLSILFIFAITMTACKKNANNPADEHPTGEHPSGEHPTGK